MKNRIILYQNDTTGRCMWIYQNKIVEGSDPETIEYMTLCHALLRKEPENSDLVEAIKFILLRDGADYLA